MSDREAVLAFLPQAYPGEALKGDPAFWAWHFLENPYAEPGNIPLWIVKDGETVVGQMATIPVDIKVNENVRRALWIIDFIVLPEYRGQGLGKRLMIPARETYSTTMIVLGYNEQSGPVLRSQGLSDRGFIRRYHKLLYPGDSTKEIARLGPVRGLANFAFAPLRPRLRDLAPPANAEVREIKEFDESFDQLWQDASTQWPCAIIRSSRFLDWQYRQQPGKKFDVLGYYEGDRLCGYVVLFVRKPGPGGVPNKAAITDICYRAKDPEPVIDGLIKAALKFVMVRHVGGLVIDVLDKRLERAFERHGFWRIKNAPPFMVGTLSDQELMFNLDNWFLTRGDSDVSIFEEPNI
ncbi:MAG: GNAT family N-acetyltransferase, partial [Pyrinomonadaceae bacterium]